MTGFRRDGAVAVITGAASGIGRGLGRALVGRAESVVLADIDGDALSIVADELAGAGLPALAVPTDVSDLDAVDTLVARTLERFGRADLVVANAGIGAPHAPFFELEPADVERVMAVNYFGVHWTVRAFARHLLDRPGPGHFLVTGSENSLGAPVLRMAGYTASKHAVHGLADVMRRELPPRIGVTLLCPGIVNTALAPVGENDGSRAGIGYGADEVATWALDAVERGDFYCIPHPPIREFVDERHDEISATFDARAPRFDGDGVHDTRALLARMMPERVQPIDDPLA